MIYTGFVIKNSYVLPSRVNGIIFIQLCHKFFTLKQRTITNIVLRSGKIYVLVARYQMILGKKVHI